MQMNNENEVQCNRILSRVLARELTAEEVEGVSGGTTSVSCGCADDCDSPTMDAVV
jgi:hypothetical protein